MILFLTSSTQIIITSQSNKKTKRKESMKADLFTSRQQAKTLTHSRTSISLNQLRTKTQRHPLLKPQISSQHNLLVRPNKSRGNLRMGSVSKPSLILPKELRKDPFHKATQFTEQLLSKKGLCQLVSMGVISKQADCYELLNLRYEYQPKPAEPAEFLTNPAILINTYYQQNKSKEPQEPTPKASANMVAENQKQKTRKIRSSKKKVVKKEEPLLILKEVVKLTVVNSKFLKDDTYQQYIKDIRRKGGEIEFREFQKKVEAFASKYQIKKFMISPVFDPTKKIKESDIVKTIFNSNLLGIERKLKGTSRDIFRNLLKMKLTKIRFKNLKIALQRMQKVKSKFKIKKYYREMLNKRWEYLTFKLGAFAETQRRAIETTTRAEVEIHLVASDLAPQSTATYYRWQERSSSHLFRLYNNESDHLILLHHRNVDLTPWLSDIEATPSSWKKPSIHLIETHLPDQYSEIPECAQLYFGLLPDAIRKIKGICSNKKAVLIPYTSSKYLALLCEVLGVELMGGTFTQTSNAILFEEEHNNDNSENQQRMQAKFKKLAVNSLEMTKHYRNKMEKIGLASSLFERKNQAKKVFASLKIPSPLSLGISGMNQRDFFRELVRTILRYKDQSKWLLKLPDSTFSRGLVLLETDSLKILKQNKKKATLSDQQLNHIAKIMEYILVQKVFIPHNSLLTGQEFMVAFKQRGGYIESYIDNASSVCFFGRIQFNGLFTLLGSYKKYQAEMVSFGALYPGITITSQIKNQLSSIATALFHNNVFGYITIQTLVDSKGNLNFIDIVPHLQTYSELYFYYKRLLDINEIDGDPTTLTKTLFYCPFLDNNGNKTDNFQDFTEIMSQKKIKFDLQHKNGTKFWALSENSASVMAMLVCGKDENWVIKEALQALSAIVEIGGPFNKFAKGARTSQCDGLYLLDIIWKLRQLKKDAN